MTCRDLWKKPPVTTKPFCFAIGFCGDRRPDGHVVHTSRQAVIQTYNRNGWWGHKQRLLDPSQCDISRVHGIIVTAYHATLQVGKPSRRYFMIQFHNEVFGTRYMVIFNLALCCIGPCDYATYIKQIANVWVAAQCARLLLTREPRACKDFKW